MNSTNSALVIEMFGKTLLAKRYPSVKAHLNQALGSPLARRRIRRITRVDDRLRIAAVTSDPENTRSSESSGDGAGRLEHALRVTGSDPSSTRRRAGRCRLTRRSRASWTNAHRRRADRLAAVQAAVFHFLIGNADAHAKNIGLLYTDDGVRLAPVYDAVCTAVYPGLSEELAPAIGDELEPAKIDVVHWGDLAVDFGLNLSAFERVR